MKDKIKGGYYMKARCIQNSEIAIMPPYVREIWDWLLKEANHTDRKVNGIVIKRGQLIRTFKDIQRELHWMIGWRKMTYKKWQCEKAMKFLRERAMITTMKTTRGMFITICNYEYYQNPKNYESNKKADTITTDQKQTADTINKNLKNVKNKIHSTSRINFNYKTKKWENITEEDLKDWSIIKPNCNIKIELEHMRQHLIGLQEGDKRRVKKYFRKFITGWIRRSDKYKVKPKISMEESLKKMEKEHG